MIVPDQFVEFIRVLLLVAKRIWIDLEGDVAQGWITNDKALEDVLRSVLVPAKKPEQKGSVLSVLSRGPAVEKCYPGG